MGNPRHIDHGGNTLIVDGIRVGATAPGQLGTELTGTEIALLDGLTAGTVTASKAVTADSNKDVSAFRNVTVTNLDAGASGTAGTVDIFPTTASTGKTAITATANSGNTTNTITNAAQTTTATWTIPDTNGSAQFVMTAAAQTIAGVKTFSATPVLATGTTLDIASGTATLSSNAATITEYASQITSEALTTAAGASQAFVITKTGVAATDLIFVSKAGGTNTRKNFSLEAVATTNTVTVTLYNDEPTNAINGTVIFNVWVIKP